MLLSSKICENGRECIFPEIWARNDHNNAILLRKLLHTFKIQDQGYNKLG